MPHSTQLPIHKVITQFANAHQQSTATGSIQIPFQQSRYPAAINTGSWHNSLGQQSTL